MRPTRSTLRSTALLLTLLGASCLQAPPVLDADAEALDLADPPPEDPPDLRGDAARPPDAATPIPPVPDALVRALSAKPYVEDACVAATYSGWPHDALRCTYKAGPLTATVTVADPPAARVAAWIVDSSIEIPRLLALASAQPAAYEAGLLAIAQATLYQSSRIFPLTGGIIEDMGSGYVNYPFEQGVTKGCTTGCYCRINSLHRSELCRYRAARTTETYDACLARLGQSGLTAAWGQQCLQNHADAWLKSRNEHYRAKAFIANSTVVSRCPTPAACTPDQVVAAVKAAFGL